MEERIESQLLKKRSDEKEGKKPKSSPQEKVQDGSKHRLSELFFSFKPET